MWVVEYLTPREYYSEIVALYLTHESYRANEALLLNPPEYHTKNE